MDDTTLEDLFGKVSKDSIILFEDIESAVSPVESNLLTWKGVVRTYFFVSKI
jgi:hypothetical protein